MAGKRRKSDILNETNVLYHHTLSVLPSMEQAVAENDAVEIIRLAIHIGESTGRMDGHAVFAAHRNMLTMQEFEMYHGLIGIVIEKLDTLLEPYTPHDEDRDDVGTFELRMPR